MVENDAEAVYLYVQSLDSIYVYKGGPGQLPHVAPTYAAVLALCTLGTEMAYQAIDR